MAENIDKGRCLTEEEIGTLAIKLGAPGGTAPDKGQSAELPLDLLSCLDQSTLSHLKSCNSCTRRLLSEARVYRAYFEPTDTSKADLEIRRRLRADLREILGRRKYKFLSFCPYELPLDEPISLAAATSRTTHRPLMFAEEEDGGDLIFKRERDLRSGKEVCYLVGQDSDFTNSVDVLIDGQLYRTDATGRVQSAGKCPPLTEDTIIVVFPSES